MSHSYENAGRQVKALKLQSLDKGHIMD